MQMSAACSAGSRRFQSRKGDFHSAFIRRVFENGLVVLAQAHRESFQVNTAPLTRKRSQVQPRHASQNLVTLTTKDAGQRLMLLASLLVPTICSLKNMYTFACQQHKSVFSSSRTSRGNPSLGQDRRFLYIIRYVERLQVRMAPL